MPRGIPNAKPAAKATAAKPTVTQTTTPLKEAVMSLTPQNIEAILELEAHFKAAIGGRPMYGMHYRDGQGRVKFSDAFLSAVARTYPDRFPAQEARIYVKGEVLTATKDFDIILETQQVSFTIDGKIHPFSYGVESDLYVDLSDYSGVLLTPVPTGVKELIEATKATAQASGEESLAIYLKAEAEAAAFEVGDRVRKMLGDQRTFVVVKVVTPMQFDRFGGGSDSEVKNDLILAEVFTDYAIDSGSTPRVGDAFKAYSGLYIKAPV